MKILLNKLTALPSHNRIFGLDFLRAIAILGVLLAHGSVFFTVEQLGRFNLVLGFSGVLGVELFFVLSGFLIGSILLKLEDEFQQVKVLPHFWLRRWFRTLPNYWFFLLLYILATWIISSPLPNLLQYLTFTQNLLWQHPFFFDQAWSLAIEEWFYLLFPLVLFIMYRLTRSFNVSFLLTAGIFILVPSTLRVQWASSGVEQWGEIFRKIILLRLDAIMYGVLAAWFKQKYQSGWHKNRYIFFISGLLLQPIIWSLALSINFDESFFARTFFFTIMSLSFALLIPTCDQWDLQNKNFSITAIRLIALWSYSLYLCNFLLAQILSNITEYLIITSLAGNFGFYVLYIVSSLVLSGIIYTFLEKPAMDLRERFSKSA